MAFEVFGDGIALRSKGDILSSDGSSAYAVNAGADGQILVAQSSATPGIQWNDFAGGDTQKFVFISSTTISATTSTVTLSNIPQTYRDLWIVGTAKNSSTLTGTVLELNLNFNSNTTANFDRMIFTALATATTITDSTVNGNSTITSSYLVYDGSSRSVFEARIMNYTTSAITGWTTGGYVSREINTSAKGRMHRCHFNARGGKTPVTSINIIAGSGGFATQGFRIDLFGIKE